MNVRDKYAELLAGLQGGARVKLGSLFAGIGGFDKGFRDAGFEIAWEVEKEPFCQSILKTHFPEAKLFDDVRTVGKHNLADVDVLTAGFPCQDLSVAGKRAGLEGSRSGLFWEVVRILGELRPTWFVLENVPGLFSSCEGRDFAVVLNALDELGYGVAWRVLNSQFFGVAQRRRRVFIVGRFGKPCPEAVLFEPEGGRGDTEARDEAREGTSGKVGDGIVGTLKFSATGGACRLDAEQSADGFLVATHAAYSEIGPGWWRDGIGTLRAEGENRPSRPSNIVQQAISSKWAKGSSGPAGDEHHNLTVVSGVPVRLRSIEHVARVELGVAGMRVLRTDSRGQCDVPISIQDARGQRDKRQNGIGISEGGPMYTLDGTSQHAVGCADNEHEERSSQQFDSAAEVDGRVRGTVDDGSPSYAHGMRGTSMLPTGLDSARYRALGNAVTTSVARWIAGRILSL